MRNDAGTGAVLVTMLILGVIYGFAGMTPWESALHAAPWLITISALVGTVVVKAVADHRAARYVLGR